MSTKVSLKSFIQDMQMVGDMISGYLNRNTGKVTFFGEEEISAAEEENEEDWDDYSDWQKEAIKEAKVALSSDDYISLPSQFEIHEWQMMKDFCEEMEHGNIREDLEFAIHGGGAFRNFKRNLDRHDLMEHWYAFRDEAYKKVAREWLKENGVEYEE